MKNQILLLCLLSIALSLPYEDQIALANSLEVGRDEDPNTWECTGCDEGNKPIHSYFIEQNQKDVRATVSVYAEYTVLSFRYTATLKNLWQDILFAFQVQDDHACDGCKVQKEYENMWNSIRDQTIEGLRKVDHTNTLIITGISLGGGLAQLSFVDIQASRIFKSVKLTTWGAPRVGNAKWADWLNAHTQSRRFFINSDPIPALPRCLGLVCNYKQAGKAFSCNHKSDNCVCSSKNTASSPSVFEASNMVVALAKQHFKEQENVDGILAHVLGYKTLYKCSVQE